MLICTSSFAFANNLQPYSDLKDLKQNPCFGTRPWEKELYASQKKYKDQVNKECRKKEKLLVEKIRKEKIRKQKLLEEKRKESEEQRTQEKIQSISNTQSTFEKTYEYQKSAAKKIENSKEYKAVQGNFTWGGPVLTRSNGVVQGPHGRETYYNLPMDGVVNIMRNMGNTDKYWIRSDGCKMLGNYIMVAAKVDSSHKRGRIIKCSRGYAIVCDTGSFLSEHPNGVDIAVNW